MTGRTSYARLARLPAWGLYDYDGELHASVRARNAPDARVLFQRDADKLLLPRRLLSWGGKIRRIADS